MVTWTAAVVLLTTSTGGTAVSMAPVANIEVVADGVLDGAAVTEILGLEIGQPLDRRQLRAAIQALFARTEVEWLRVEADEGPEGLAVVVRVNLRTTISAIRVEAQGPVARRRIERWLELAVGQRVSAAQLEATQRRVERRLRERGFADATVELSIAYERETNTAAVTVAVAAGMPQVVGEVVVSGPIDPEIAAAASPGVDPGSRLDEELRDRIRRRVEARLRTLGYWEAQVLEIQPRTVGEHIDLAVVVDPGVAYELQIQAPADREKAVRSAVPDPADGDLHPAQTAALAEQVRERLQEQGFLLAEVDATLETTTTPRVLAIRASPGVIRRITDIEFPGVQGVARDRLLEVVRVRPGRVAGLLGQRVSDSTLEEDRQALLEVLHSAGYSAAEVKPPVLLADGDDAVRVVFEVTEGQRWLVSELRIEGLPVEAAVRLEEIDFALEEAAPWHSANLEIGRRQLELALADTGYPEGRVTSRVDLSVSGEAAIELTVEPGPFVRIGQVVITGLTTTDEHVVERAIRSAGVQTGAPFARASLLEAQRKLYELGLFRRVELFPTPGQERRIVRGLVVNCEDGRQRSYLVGVGWNETDRFRVTVGWSHLNLFGSAHAFTAEARLSAREQRLQLGLREPRLPLIDAPGYLVVYRTFEEFATFSQRRRGLWFEVGDRRRVPVRPWLRYEYQIVEPDAPPEVLSDLERENQEARIASVTPTLELDYRDDPLVPTDGSLTAVSLEYAFPALQADAEYLKLQAKFSLYRRVFDGVGAFGVRLGAIEPLTGDPDVPPNLRVPLNTRFFAGGSSTHRAFRTDYLGIRGATLDSGGDPIGGNAIVLLNFEYQRPLNSLVSLAVFVDAGNIWSEPSRFAIGDLRWGAGLGIRFDTPAGPLRAEYGHKLDRKPGESTGEFFLSFGIPF